MAPNNRRSLHRTYTGWTAFKAFALTVAVSWIPLSHAAVPPLTNLQRRAEIGGGVDLRVLPIGDSITWGAHSTDGNGYRGRLHDLLTARGNNVDFVGGTSTGTMADNDHEGHRGLEIDAIRESSTVGVYAAPNIALVHAGTNDMKNIQDNTELANTPERLGNLIDDILKYSPDALVLVCQIIPASPVNYPNTAARIPDFNAAIPDLVAQYGKDQRVLMVNMNEAVSADQLFDGLHPNDIGYANMADKFYAAIEDADGQGLISKPGTPSEVPTGTNPNDCKPTPSWYRVPDPIALGASVAVSDGDFNQSWVEVGVIAEGACPGAQVHFMDLDGDGFKDFACVDPETGSTQVLLSQPDSQNRPSGKWTDLGIVATGEEGRDGTGVMFADLNGDGRDDYIYVDPANGDVYAWINRLSKDNVWQWQSLGRIAGGVGATNDTLQMVDIDGDGRADFCLVDKKTGVVTGWLNTGADIMPDYYKLGIIATGASQTDGDRVILGDFTGEGRADYMYVGVGGKVNGLVNRLNETSLVSRWLPVITVAEGPSGVKAAEVRLVDMTGDGKVDYLVVDEKTGKTTLWENIGTGGKYQPGEGVVLCDLDGDGVMDYFWLSEHGRGWGYLSHGQGENVWDDLGEIATAPEGHDRNQVRMGVLTSSGRADYIVVDDDTGHAVCLDGDGYDDYLYVNDEGAVFMWRNLQTIPTSWGLPHLVADGVGVLARQVQFADVDGDGLLDYNVVGSVTGMTRTWHNLGFDNNTIRWNTPLSFADGVGTPGYTVRLAQMTADKRADYVTVNPDNGALNLWINNCWPIGGDGGGDGGDGGDDGGVDPYTPNPDDDTPLPTCPYTPTTMDNITNLDYNNELPTNCVPKYLMSVLLSILEESKEKYDEMVGDDYDHYFEVYADYVVGNSGDVLNDFMLDHGEEYFNCKIWQEYPCCTTCDYKGLSCSGCIEECPNESGFNDGQEFDLRDQPCPPDYSQRNGIGEKDTQSIFWSFRNDSAEDDFYSAAEVEVGAPKKRFKIVDHSYIYNLDEYIDDTDTECLREYNELGWDDMSESCQYTKFWSDAPWVDGFVDDDVSNPKDIVQKILKNVSDVAQSMGAVTFATIADEYDGDANDLVDALVMPVLTLQAAVGFMEKVLDMGKEIEEEEKKEFIINLLSSILIVISMGGDALAESGFASLGRMLVYASEGGETAIGLYTTVEDPKSAPLAIFGIIMSGRAVLEVSEVEKAATLRRTLKDEDTAKFNKDVADYMKKVADLNKKPDLTYCRYA